MQKFQKIIIFGFPHCGTTILRSIIGHIEEVYEIIDEIPSINDEFINKIDPKLLENKKYILCKFPYTSTEFFTDEKYKDYIKIFILRNPAFVFSSLNERYNNKLPHHFIDNYLNSLSYYVANNNNDNQNITNNLYIIKYEALFYNNYLNLKRIFDTIGFNYTDEIFNNEKYVNKCQHLPDKTQIPNVKPTNQHKQHDLYRLYQINKPFINNNDVSKINLTEKQKEVFKNNELIKQIFHVYAELPIDKI
jgi:hypothetical protein